MERKYLRFVGRLWDTGEFEPGIGWETQRIARRAPATPGHRLQLCDGAGAVLAEAGVELRAGACRFHGGPGVAGQRLVGYLPLRPSGRSVVLRHGERVVYEVELAATPPRVAVESLDVDTAGRVHVRWAAEHDRPVYFNILFIDAERRAIQVVRELSVTHLALETAELPGGPGCSLAILATDGLRSSMVRSETFDVPVKPPRVSLLAPQDGDTLGPDQPTSLLGSAHDLAGRSLPDEHLVWSVDGDVVARGRRIVLIGALAPGAHRIELAYAPDGEPAAAAATAARLHVSARSAAQEAWLALSSSHAEGRARATRIV